MPKIDYIYCDANIFLAYFNAEMGRIHILDQLFEDVQKNPYRKIITSVLSITEVSHIAEEKRRSKPSQKIYDAMESFWGDTSLIEFIEVDELIARQSRDLIRAAISKEYALKTNDSIHLISAKYVGVAEFFTYDKKLEKFSATVGYEVREPYLISPKLNLDFDEE